MNTFDDLNPASGETLAQISISSSEDVRAAIARARAAQPAWAALTVEERAEHLAGLGPRLGEAAEDLAELVTREMGKPLSEALAEVRTWERQVPVELAEVILAMQVEVHPTKRGETRLHRAPLGVVAAITPWNFPIGMPLQVIVPALASGNTVVFKPSELVPLVGAAIAKITAELVPAGVLELVQGSGATGAELVAGDVDLIGFVGSRATGQHIMQSASSSLKRLVLELGGKDPLVVMADANLEAAAECAVRHSLRNAGQVCCAVERVFVAQEIAPEFERLVVQKAAEWTTGDGFDPDSRMGPLVSASQRDKVVSQVDEALSSGARLCYRGETPDGGGFFYPATVLADVSPGARISREETFGPVVSLTVFSGAEAEGVRLANETPYGLGANVYSADLECAERMAQGIHAGQVGINQYLGGAPGLPWVGARQSGFGFLGGIEGHRQFTLPKSISIPTTPTADS